MPHTFVHSEHHCIFSVKNRGSFLKDEIKHRLYEYIHAVAEKYRINLITAGGTEDHIHILINLPSTMSISEALKLIKGSTTRWIHQTFPWATDFAWQEGYGAFSVSRSIRQRTVEYIENQVEHHKRVTFDEELKLFLRKHEITINTEGFKRPL